jgi:hypothetical protein
MSEQRSTAATRLVAILAFGALVAFGILYINYTNRQNDLRWCSLMVGLDDRYQGLDTKDPDAIKFRDDVHRLRQGLRCPPSVFIPSPELSPVPSPVRSSS